MAVLEVLSAAALLVGSLFVVVGGIGLLRLPDFFTRLHAAGVTDTLGAWTVLLGLALHSGDGLVAAKLALIGLFMAFTGPSASHALAKAALHGGARPLVDGGADREPR